MPVVVAGDAAGVARAAEAIAQHEPVAMPTETVYGLAGGTFDVEAIERIYALKGRPADNPLIAHVNSPEMARTLVQGWDDRAEALADACWPGPLTMILPRRAQVPPEAAGGRDTLAVRAPDHSVAQSLLEAVGGPLSAPSANRSGHVSPTSSAHVMDDYESVQGAEDLLILDGGPAGVGLESTVLDLSESTPTLLRPGTVTLERLESLVGPVVDAVPWSQDRAPGTAERHYAPKTPLRLVQCATKLEGAAFIELPGDPESAAAALYDLLRQADTQGAREIVIVAPPDTPPWRAIHDRLRRAASSS